MLLTRLKTWLAAFIAALSVSSVACAQQFGPFIEPDSWSPDLQFFAPAEVSEYGNGEPENTGFYFTYDRMYLFVKRPDGAASMDSGHGSDPAWGNRYDMGFMTEDRVGWLVSVMDSAGPNARFVTEIPRIPAATTNTGGGGTGGGTTTTTTQTLPQRDLNWQVTQYQNVGSFNSVEIDRVWRRKEFHGGGVFEPLVGVRYIQYNDYGRNDAFQRFAEDATTFEPDFTSPNILGPWERLQSHYLSSVNQMLGGQLGFRLSKTVGHWRLGSELRMMGLNNWQKYEAYDETILRNATRGFTTTGGSGSTTGSSIIIDTRKTNPVSNSGNEFVFGGELRMEAAYEVTRDISLRGGFMYMLLGHGVARGIDPSNTASTAKNSQDLYMGGVTFGLTINR